MAGISQDPIEVQALRKHIGNLKKVIADNPSMLGDLLIENEFAVRDTVNDIMDTPMLGNQQKGKKLLDLVDTKISTAGKESRKYFDAFLKIIAYRMGHIEIAKSLVATLKSKDPSYKSPLQEDHDPLIHSPGNKRPTPPSAEDDEPKYNEGDLKKIRRSKQPKVLPREKEEDIKTFMSQVVILLHTVKVEETVAVYNHLKPPFDLGSTVFYQTGNGIEVTLGMFGDHKAALIRTMKGGDCREEIERALESLPGLKLIIAVGFAYGRRDKCKLGDVLVSTAVDGAGNVRVDKSGEILIEEGRVRHTAMSVQATNTFTTRNWIDFVCSSDEKRESEIHCGVVISAPILMNNLSALEKLIARERRFIGGEMEGQELARVTHFRDKEYHNVDFIVIKGVADFGDGTKEKDWQFTASLAAVAFAEKRLEETQNRVFYLQQAAVSESNKSPPLDESKESGSSKATGTATPAQANEKEGRLNIDHHMEVVGILWSVRDMWKDIGGVLGVDQVDISTIESEKKGNPNECLKVVIRKWLLMASIPAKPVTWAGLVAALEQPMLKVSCGAIAEKITKDYINVQ